MSSAAPQRVPTDGWSKVPNSLIENQHIFTPAEFSFALIVLRKGGMAASVQVSDTNWERWTGRNSRMKEYAIKGLRDKGFAVDGRGEHAKYRFDRGTWETFVHHASRSKPHTAGRPVGVTPKPGAKIHPACRESGCAMMERDKQAAGVTLSSLSLVTPTPNAQPVARTGCAVDAPGLRESTTRQTGLSSLSPAPIAQPVAQIHDTAESVWALTLAKLREFFPLVGAFFLVRLVAVVCAMFRGVTDQELAAAVQVAWNHKRKVQKAEGLFLATVPEAIAALRRAPKPPPAPDLAEGAGRLLERVGAALRARAGPLVEGPAERVDRLRSQIEAEGLSLEIYEQLELIEAEIVAAGRGTLTEDQHFQISERIQAELGRPEHSGYSKLARENFKARLDHRFTLDALGIPSLAGCYA